MAIARFLDRMCFALHPGAIQGKEGIKFCHLATLFEIISSHFLPFSVSEHDGEHGVCDDRLVLRQPADLLLPPAAGREGGGRLAQEQVPLARPDGCDHNEGEFTNTD